MEISPFKDLAKQLNFTFIEVLTMAANYSYLWCLSQVYFPIRLHHPQMEVYPQSPNPNQVMSDLLQ